MKTKVNKKNYRSILGGIRGEKEEKKALYEKS